jgi:hypothetical protein
VQERYPSTSPLLSISGDGSIISGTYYAGLFHISAFTFDTATGTLTSIGNLFGNIETHNS